MPSERLSMRRIRELLRLKYENGLPGRVIAAVAGAQQGGGARLPAAADGGGVELAAARGSDRYGAWSGGCFLGRRAPDRRGGRSPTGPMSTRELRRKGVTRIAALAGISRRSSGGLRLLLVLRALRRPGRGGSRRRCARRHGAGEKVFVDYAGDTIDIIDPASGAMRPMKLFVAAMGASSYIYAEARPRRRARRLDRLPCRAVRLLGRRARHDRLRQPQVGRDQARSLRAGDQPHLPGDGRATMGPASCRRGRTSRATRPRWSSRCCWSSAGSWPACATGASSAWPISTPPSPPSSANSTPG